MGTNHKGEFAIINDAFISFKDITYRLETFFEADRVVFLFGTKKKILHDKIYSYEQIYKFQKDFMKVIDSIKDDKNDK